MVDLNKLKELSGEDQGAPKYDVPIVRIDGNDGYFYRIEKQADGSTKSKKIGEEIIGTPLKYRRTLQEFNEDFSLFTNEHNSWKDVLTLFERKETKKGMKTSMLDTGNSKELREKYQGLRMTQIIYFLLDTKEVVKLQVKGASLSSLFEFREKLKKDKSSSHTFQFVLKIGSKECEMKKLKKKYYAMSFAVLKEVEDMDFIAKKMEEVDNKIKEIDEHYANKKYSEDDPFEDGIKTINVDDDDIPVIDKEKDEDIDPKDIPF